MTLQTIPVTLAAGATPVSATRKLVKQVIIQDNAAAVCRVGDSAVSASRGIQLAASGAAGSVLTLGDGSVNSVDLSTLFLFGTATQIIDVLAVF